MIEVINRIYTQRFLAKSLKRSDLFKAVTYTQYEGDWEKIPFFYKKIQAHTGTVDLTRSMESIDSSMKSTMHNQIRRAIKEGCTYEYKYNYEEFVKFYNEFSKTKGLNDIIDIHTLEKYNKTIITIAKDKQGNPLVMHATVMSPDNEAMLLYSCSKRLEDGANRNLIGWANRFLHYKEFELFKSWGIKRYEWNGIETNPEKKETYNIGLFKLQFGTELKDSLGLRTPLFVLLKSIQKIIRKWK